MKSEFDELFEKVGRVDERDWITKIDLSKAYKKEYTDETIQEAGRITARAINSFISAFRDSSNENLVNAVKELEDSNIVDGFENVDSVEEYDDLLEDLYDIGDTYSIWIETKF
jgi:hypothetical protein